MGFNSALAEAGEFGLYQRLLCFVFLLTAIAYLSFSYWIQIFILLVPDHHCRTSDSRVFNDSRCSLANFTTSATQWMSNISSCPDGWEYDFSSLFPTAATETILTGNISNKTFENVGFGSILCAIEVRNEFTTLSDLYALLFSCVKRALHQAFRQNDWVCENAWRVYAVHTFYWIGSILGQLLFGCLTDKFGRKKTFWWVVLLSVLSNMATIMAPDHMTFTTARFLTAFGISTISTTSFMIVMEYTGPSNRTIVLCTWAATWTLCAAMLPWIAYFLRNWRLLLCVPFVPASVLLLVSWWVPESASWLMTKGQIARAAELLHRVAQVNGKNLNSQHFYDCLSSSHVDSINTKSAKKESFVRSSLGLIRYPNMRKKTFVLLVTWLIIHLCYNGNSLQTSHLPFNTYISFSVGAFLEIPVNMFCILSLDRFGRKWPDVICLYVGGILGIISGCLSKRAVHEVFTMAMLVRITFAAGTNITFQYTAELFPTEVRGRGLSLQRMFGAIGSCLAPTVVFLSEIDPLLPMFVLGCLSLIAGSLIIILPETTGLQLPHTLEEGETFGAHETICSIFPKRVEPPFGRDNVAADVPQGTHGVFISTVKETAVKQ